MNWIFFILGAVVFIGASCVSPDNWRQQIHSWFGVWTGIAIMFIALYLEYVK